VGKKDKRRIYHGGTEEEGERIEQKGAKGAKLREEGEMLAEPIFQICSASVVPEEMKKAKKRGSIF
jgi:hypothetical protein